MEKIYDAIIYTDGSYKNGIFTYGIYFMNNKNNNVDELNAKFNNQDWAKMRNVAGEIMAVVKAIIIALKQGLKNILICHDYNGLNLWVTEEWKAKDKKTKMYKKFVMKAKEKINIEFKWVKAHNNDIFNDKADKLANAAYNLDEFSDVIIDFKNKKD